MLLAARITVVGLAAGLVTFALALATGNGTPVAIATSVVSVSAGATAILSRQTGLELWAVATGALGGALLFLFLGPPLIAIWQRRYERQTGSSNRVSTACMVLGPLSLIAAFLTSLLWLVALTAFCAAFAWWLVLLGRERPAA